MNKLIASSLIACVVLVGCSSRDSSDAHQPPVAPTKAISGSVLPSEAGDYSVLGADPIPDQLTATYAHNSSPLDLAVVSFDLTGQYMDTYVADSQWYGPSRCGILWESSAQKTPQPHQVACITVLTDGVMTTVSGGQQSVEDIAELANDIERSLKHG